MYFRRHFGVTLAGCTAQRSGNFVASIQLDALRLRLRLVITQTGSNASVVEYIERKGDDCL